MDRTETEISKSPKWHEGKKDEWLSPIDILNKWLNKSETEQLRAESWNLTPPGWPCKRVWPRKTRMVYKILTSRWDHEWNAEDGFQTAGDLGLNRGKQNPKKVGTNNTFQKCRPQGQWWDWTIMADRRRLKRRLCKRGYHIFMNWRKQARRMRHVLITCKRDETTSSSQKGG